MRITLHVDGTPAPKGSPKVVTRGRGGVPLPYPRVLADSPATRSWAAEVASAAREHMALELGAMFVGVALSVTVVFRLVRPAGHYGKSGLRPAAPRYPATKPDLDKLIRATMDPLEGVVYDGDSRIVHFDARKVYCAPGEVAGADITIELAEAPAVRADATQPALAFGGAA